MGIRWFSKLTPCNDKNKYHLGWDNSIRTNDCIIIGDWRDPPYTTINSYAGVFSTFTAYSILSGSDIRGSQHALIIN